MTATPVHQFADRAWSEYLELNPLWATVQGIETWDDRLDDPSAAGRAALMAVVERWAVQVDELSRDELSVEDTVTLGLMRAVIRRFRGAHELRLWEFDALDQISGPQSLVGELARFQRTDTPQRFENLLRRLAAYPGWMAAHRANVEAGLESGRTAPSAVVERCISQTRELLETPSEASPLMVVNAGLGEEQRAALLAAVNEHVQPALRDWLLLLERCAADARAGDGVCHLPDGAAVYRHAIRSYTNLDEEPQAIHDYGLQRLDEIEAAEASIAAELGHESVAALRVFLDADPDNHAQTPAEMVALAEAWVRRAEVEAPKWFGNPPREHCEVRAVEAHAEKSAPAGFYYPPADDGSRPGMYFLNTYDPSSRPLHQIVPMTFHEAVPGHHFQLTTERHLDGLPAFRDARCAARVWRLCRGLGPVLRASRRGDGSLPHARWSASVPGNRRRTAPPVWSSIPACTRSAGRAASRSTCSSNVRGCHDSKPRSRPTATSHGRVRRSATCWVSARS